MRVNAGRVYKRGDTFYIDYHVDGKRVREAVGKDEGQAHRALERRKEGVIKGVFNLVSRRRVRFSDFTERYIEIKRTHGRRSMRQIERCASRLRDHFEGFLLSQVSQSDVEDYAKKRLKDRVMGATVNRELACLKNIFSVADRLGEFCGRNPVKGFEFFREEKRDAHILDLNELRRLLDASGERMRRIILLAWGTGMRRGEILGLRWADIDFERGSIFLKKTKSGKPRRVQLDPVVAEVLKAIERTSEYVFPNSKTGGPVRDTKTAWIRARTKAELPKTFRFHDLRHNFGTLLSERGVSLPTIMEMLGHAQISTTMRYQNPTTEAKTRAASILGSLLTNAGIVGTGAQPAQPTGAASLSDRLSIN
jgi:integrase